MNTNFYFLSVSFLDSIQLLLLTPGNSFFLLFPLLLRANINCLVIFDWFLLSLLWARPYLLWEVYLVSTRRCWLHGFPCLFWFLLDALAVLVFAFFFIGNGVNCTFIKWLLVHAHVAWVKVLATTLTSNVKSAYFRFVQVHFRRLFNHVIKCRKEDLWERLSEVRAV